MTEYLYYWLSSEMSKKFVLGKSSGSIQKYVSLGFLRNFPIPIPSAEEISGIVKILDIINQKISMEISRRDVLEKLFQSMIQKLMTGKLRVPQELMEN